MDNPFSADNTSPFLTPYQAPEPPAPAGVKPFAAADLGPPAESMGPRQSAHGEIRPDPFAETEFDRAFMGRDSSAIEAPIVRPMQSAPRPPEVAPDYSAVPMAADSSALRKSDILFRTGFDRDSDPQIPEFFCTTTPSVEGLPIRGYLGVVSVEIVVPKDLLFQNPAPYGELHRIKAAEEQLQRVKAAAMAELSARAKQLGAEAVVGVAVVFSPFDAIVCLCSAVGTAVKLSK